MTAVEPTEPTHLKRALGTGGLTLFGLTYLAPVTVFTTYGIVSQVTNNHLSAAYIVALIAMLFTASSYGRMARAYPIAGSAYSYTQQSFGGGLGFLTGWTLMLDYLFLPMINFLLIGLYLNAEFPAVPAWVFALISVIGVWVLNIVGITMVNRVNLVIVALSVLLVVLFVVFSLVQLTTNPPADMPNLFTPLLPGDEGLTPILAGAAILALSFLGFDAVSTMSEEAKNPVRDIPRGIMLTTVFGGVIFIVVTWVGALVYPSWQDFVSVDTASAELVERVGGAMFGSFFIAVYVVGAFGSGLASQVSVARILFAMGRDGVLPKPLARLSPRFRTPVVAATLVSIVSLLSLVLTLDVAATMISFGALAAFSMVNLAVIRHYVFPKGGTTDRSLGLWLGYGLVPLIGFGLTVWLWTSLSGTTMLIGAGWIGLGVIILAIITKGFRRPAPQMDFSEREEILEAV